MCPRAESKARGAQCVSDEELQLEQQARKLQRKPLNHAMNESSKTVLFIFAGVAGTVHGGIVPVVF